MILWCKWTNKNILQAFIFGVLFFLTVDNLKSRRKKHLKEICFRNPSHIGDENVPSINFVQLIDDEDEAKCLTPRAICAIESVSRSNPESPIYIQSLVLTSKGMKRKRQKWPLRKPGNIRSCEVSDFVLNEIKNMQHVIHLGTERFNDTRLNRLLGELYAKSNVYSTIERDRLTQVLKLLTLKQYGGICLDFDVIITQSMKCVQNVLFYDQEILHSPVEYPYVDPSNNEVKVDISADVREERFIKTNVMAFEQKHSLLNNIIDAMVAPIPDDNSFDGLTETISSHCKLHKIQTGRYPCNQSWINIFRSGRLFPHLLTTPIIPTDLGTSLGVSLHKSSPSVYNILAPSYCPVTWEQVRHLKPPYGF